MPRPRHSSAPPPAAPPPPAQTRDRRAGALLVTLSRIRRVRARVAERDTRWVACGWAPVGVGVSPARGPGEPEGCRHDRGRACLPPSLLGGVSAPPTICWTTTQPPLGDGEPARTPLASFRRAIGVTAALSAGSPRCPRPPAGD